jgi:hypothetical protein
MIIIRTPFPIQNIAATGVRQSRLAVRWWHRANQQYRRPRFNPAGAFRWTPKHLIFYYGKVISSDIFASKLLPNPNLLRVRREVQSPGKAHRLLRVLALLRTLAPPMVTATPQYEYSNPVKRFFKRKVNAMYIYICYHTHGTFRAKDIGTSISYRLDPQRNWRRCRDPEHTNASSASSFSRLPSSFLDNGRIGLLLAAKYIYGSISL